MKSDRLISKYELKSLRNFKMNKYATMIEIKALLQKFTNSTLNEDEKIYLNTPSKKVIFTATKIISLQLAKNHITYTEYDISSKERMKIISRETLGFSTSLGFVVKFHFKKVHAETELKIAQ